MSVPLFTMAPRPGTYQHTHYPNHPHNGIFSSMLAAEAAIVGYTSRPWDFEPRRVTWQERELHKFNHSIYTHPPFVEEDWWTEIPGHFVHISLDEPTKIAFTENEQKGERDIQQRMAPGRYLQKFYTGGPADTRPAGSRILTAKEVAFFSEWFLKGQKPTEQFGGEVKFAATPDAIIDVYSRGPDSCMRYMDCVRVYGAGDLAIAYVEDANNRVISRALCWPDQKVFGRVYPTPSGYYSSDGYANKEESQAVQDDLRYRLRKMGFRGPEEGGTMEGARLLKIEENGYYVGPYIDDQDLWPNEHPTDRRFLVFGSNVDYDIGDGRNTGGFFHENGSQDEDDEDSWGCERCDERYPDHVSCYTIYNNWTPLLGANGESSYCRYCQESNSFQCEATDEHYSDHNCSQVEVNLEVTVERWSYEHEMYYPQPCRDTQTWVDDYAGVHAFLCPVTHEYYHLDLAVELHDGTLVSPDTEWFTDPKDGLNYLEES